MKSFSCKSASIVCCKTELTDYNTFYFIKIGAFLTEKSKKINSCHLPKASTELQKFVNDN